jgi:hypothetical protein
MAAGSAFTGAVWNQRKAGAIVDAGIVFSFAYLLGFVQLQMQPLRNPTGTVESLNAAALVHTFISAQVCFLMEQNQKF